MSRCLLRSLTVIVFAAGFVVARVSDAADPIEDSIRATARISSGPESATAFVVDLGADRAEGKRFALVTAAHVFEEMKASSCIVHFRLPDDDAGFVRRETELNVSDDGRPLWTKHDRADVAAIPIELPAGVDVEPFDVDRIADETFFEAGKVQAAQAIYVPCFPAKVESNEAGFPIVRRGSIASYPLKPPIVGDTLLVDYSNFGGDSGAPVTMTFENEPIVIGITTGSLRQTDKASTDFEERTTHMPLGLATVVRSVLILETLEGLEEAR